MHLEYFLAQPSFNIPTAQRKPIIETNIVLQCQSQNNTITKILNESLRIQQTEGDSPQTPEQTRAEEQQEQRVMEEMIAQTELTDVTWYFRSVSELLRGAL